METWKYYTIGLLIAVAAYFVALYFVWKRGGLPEMDPVPKIYQLNDCDWWAGHDLESVKAAYVRETGVPPEDAFDNPRELTVKEMDTLLYVDEDSPDKEPLTFRQELDRMIEEGFKFPWFFASTEY